MVAGCLRPVAICVKSLKVNLVRLSGYAGDIYITG